MHLITEWIVTKCINNSVCRHFPLIITQTKLKISINGTVSILWCGAYIGATLDKLLFLATEQFSTCLPILSPDYGNRHSTIFTSKCYLMYIVQTVGNSKCNILLSEFFKIKLRFLRCYHSFGITVGIMTCYGIENLGIESQWRQDLPHPCRPALGPTQPPKQFYRVCYSAKKGGLWCWPHRTFSA